MGLCFNRMATTEDFNKNLAKCRELFIKKLHDYGVAWRIMRPTSITDQLYIKANRIRTLETKKRAMVEEGIVPEFVGIVNYGLMGLIQLDLPVTDKEDLTAEEAIVLYDQKAKEVRELMLKKNHDYDEAWRGMRISSFTDLILMKIFRTKQIEDLNGATLASEGIAANYTDMINYAIFALIKSSDEV